jgi:exosome complex component RRP46
MAVSAAPEADFDILPRADGSATYKYAGYTITASVNGPIEAARRDEHPYKANVDVVVRPAAGVGGKRFHYGYDTKKMGREPFDEMLVAEHI